MTMDRQYSGGFRKLIAWQEAMKLAIKVYAIIGKFQRPHWHIVDQMGRATSSVTANIAEGSAMPTKAHRNTFYAHARGSAVELDNFSELCFRLKLITQMEYNDLLDHIARVTYLITRLMQSR
ncbi:MAG: four helix bundle protein [Patescibacteria group bacterium]